MIGYLSNKGQKKAAWFLFFLFYFQFAISSFAGGFGRATGYDPYGYGNHSYARHSYLKPHYNNPEPGLTSIVKDQAVSTFKNNKDLASAKSTHEKAIDNTSQKPFIGGPSQPEMSTFKSIGADNMVNLFTGDFSYNIPLLDVGGYPVNIFYNAGVSMDQDPSWVGLGWNINPGTVSRNMRGVPDDFDGSAADGDWIKKVQHVKPDLTVGVNIGGGIEIHGHPTPLGGHAGIFWNNRRGVGLEIAADYSLENAISRKTKTDKTKFDTTTVLGSAQVGMTLNSQSGLSLSGSLGLDILNTENDKNTKSGISTSIGYNSRQGLTDLKIEQENSFYKTKHEPASFPGIFGGTISFARTSFTPSIRMPLTHFNGDLKVKLGGAITIFHSHAYIAGSLTNSYIADEDITQTRPAYGYMYYERANTDNNAMLDFNRLNDGTYTLKTPVISVPNYTYDLFTINGEGTGGTFRGYRGNPGFVRDNYTKSRDGSFNLTVDAGTGFLFHGGTEIGGVYSKTEVGDWTTNNILRNSIRFNKSDSTYQGFYFKNPAEKAIIDEQYYNSMGGDRLVRPKLTNPGVALPTAGSSFETFDADKKYSGDVPLTAVNTAKKIRDKRTQIITYLTAEEAYHVGLDSCIYSYTENMFKPGNCFDPSYKTKIRRFNPGDNAYYRKAHHLSEIDVLEGDGKRYVYGLPAYTLTEKNVTFSLGPGQGNSQTQLTGYDAGQNSPANNSGRDGYFQSEEVPAYAHSFLLTAILSPDYVDVKGDGITDDDIGTAVKFNYTRVNKQGTNSWIPQKWRSPMSATENTAHYNEGLKTDNADDRGLYTYGQKELWYTHSIETKNMVATFTLSERADGKQASGENGGVSTANGQRKLDRIDLYTKADFVKNGSAARPVKSVHFAYSYTLCKGVPNNPNANQGKLTLDSLWFSYNGNYKQTKNKYRFRYAAGRSGITGNPDYNTTQSDRWGNYKDNSANPGVGTNRMSNADFPYTLQNYGDTLKSNVYASAWNLEKVMLPSGAIVNVNYEADDYAYVQDRRAAQMTKIAGFANSPTETPDNNLYTFNSAADFLSNPGKMDKRFVFFDVQEPVTSKADIYAKYLDGLDINNCKPGAPKQILLKLWVLMPSNSYGSGYEPVTVYSTIKDYYLVPGNSTRICIELNTSSTGGSPIMETVLQFLKDYLPSKAYKGYDVGDQSAIRQIVSAVQGMGQSFMQAIEGFEKNLKANQNCRQVNLNYSFARLNNPIYKKLGGGHRVKSIIITDNWKKMSDPTNSNAAPLDSYYGQVYDYTTTETINNAPQTISSGVATYEPGIGNEENPFREVLQYSDKQPLGPTNTFNIELPIAETFFPSPFVGYSKVTVRSIHNKTNKNIKSGIGKQETQFYTSKDFPVFSDFTDFDSRSRNQYKPNAIMRIFFQQKQEFLTLSQGFRVILNDMNGKMKSQASYPENDLNTPINSTNYYYRLTSTSGNTFRIDNNVKVINGPDGVVNTKLMGKDVEVMNDFRDHYATTQSAQIPLNVDIFHIGPIPIILPAIFRAMFKDETLFRSATTLKVVNEYGILDSIVNVDKGSIVSTKNMVYDGETGEVLVTRTNNEFNKSTYSLSYPAHWVNSGMDLAYKNIDLTYQNVRFVNGKIQNGSEVNMANFESGDEIYVVDKAGVNVPNTSGCIVTGGPAVLPMSNEYKIWAVDVAKDDRNPVHSFIFIDRYGNPYNAADATIRVIRSGKRNLGSVSVGGISSLENPLVTTAGVEKINVSNTTRVVNASAMEFKEKWRVQDGFYSVDTTVYVKRYVPVYNLQIWADKSYAVNYYYGNCGNCSPSYSQINMPSGLLARVHPTFGSSHTHDKETQSFIHFELPSFDPANVIKDAKLTLLSHVGPPSPVFPHGFVYPIEGYDGYHSASDPIANNVGYNSFKLCRMLRTWPSNGSALWQSAFQEEQSDYYSQVLQSAPSTNSSMNYAVQPNGTDNRIPFKGLFLGMLRDKANLGYTPGVKIRMAFWPSNNHEARVCFMDTLFQHSYATFFPIIDVKYYNCADAYAVGVMPPSGSEYDSCMTPTTGRYCFSVFTRKQMNPYVYGVLGNWRPYRSYVYYGDRNETDPTTATNISKDGTIKNYENYWVPGPDSLQRTGSTKWVWNSEITQYNRKGVEIENHDPLDRYNSGVYGYQETLPIAVGNNARVREIAFEGFEDQNYKDELCEPYCKPYKRHFNVGDITSLLSSRQHHTGKYSDSIPSNNSYTINSVVLPNDVVMTPDVRIKMDSTAFSDTLFTLNGTGLLGTYYTGNYSTAITTRNPDMVNLHFMGGVLSFSCIDPGNLPPGAPCANMGVIWEGHIQVAYSGVYYFNLGGGDGVDDNGSVYINNTVVCVGDWNTPSNNMASPVTLLKGQSYTIKVMYRQFHGFGAIQLRWRLGTAGSFVPVASQNLYPLGVTVPTPTYTTGWCIKPDTIQSVHHNLIDSFSLIANRHYVFGAWVKEGTLMDSYTHNGIELKFNNNYFMADAKPSGNVIEGWQRYEFDFTVPQNAQTMQIMLKNTSGGSVFFDDLRIHPYNGNMKSFVYNPENLRLAAELDENNYALYYEYDDDGTLVRVKKETKDGIKTMTETRSALQKSLPNF